MRTCREDQYIVLESDNKDKIYDMLLTHTKAIGGLLTQITSDDDVNDNYDYLNLSKLPKGTYPDIYIAGLAMRLGESPQETLKKDRDILLSILKNEEKLGGLLRIRKIELNTWME